MDAAAEALFEHTRARVSDQDIIDFAPGDPGYGDYVRLWTKIRRSGVVPEKTEFDLSEVIGLTGWAKPEQWEDPGRFRNFRRFTSAVGIVLLHYGNEVRPPGYMAWDLIVDLDPSDIVHLALLRDVFRSTRRAIEGSDEGYPFFTFGSMILAQRADDWSDCEAAATLLIADEGAVRDNERLNWAVEDGRFLLGLTNFDSFHDDWVAVARRLKNPNNHEDVQLVIDSISQT